MSQLQKKFLAANAVDQTKIRLDNNTFLRARNAANSGDVNSFKVNASDRIEFASIPQVTSDASAANDLVRYSQFAGALDGMKPKAAVVAATTGNINLASASDPNPIDGVTLSNGDRVLLWQQTSSAQNGIYVAVTATNPTTWTRATDFDAPSEIPGAYTVSEFGTLYQGVLFVSTSSPGVIGTDPITFASRSITTYTGGDMITLTGSAFSVDLATVSGLESSNPGNAAGQLRVKLEASNPSLQIDGSNQLGVKIDTARSLSSGASGLGINLATVSGLQHSSNQLSVKLEASNPTLQIDGSNQLGVKLNTSATVGNITTSATGIKVDTDGSTIETSSNALRVKDAGITLAKLASNSVDENKIVSTTFSTTGALNGGSGTKVSVRTDASTVKINGSNNLEGLKDLQQSITLSGTDITNQYVDLSFAIYGTSASLNSASLSVVGGPVQQKTVDYTVSLTGGSGGVTRITFAGDLATGGNAALIAGDILMVSYSYLT